jgi:hypothetical protein
VQVPPEHLRPLQQPKPPAGQLPLSPTQVSQVPPEQVSPPQQLKPFEGQLPLSRTQSSQVGLTLPVHVNSLQQPPPRGQSSPSSMQTLAAAQVPSKQSNPSQQPKPSAGQLPPPPTQVSHVPSEHVRPLQQLKPFEGQLPLSRTQFSQVGLTLPVHVNSLQQPPPRGHTSSSPMQTLTAAQVPSSVQSSPSQQSPGAQAPPPATQSWQVGSAPAHVRPAQQPPDGHLPSSGMQHSLLLSAKYKQKALKSQQSAFPLQRFRPSSLLA